MGGEAARTPRPTSQILLRTELGAGHGGPSGRYDAWRDEAFILAFVLSTLGIDRVARHDAVAEPLTLRAADGVDARSRARAAARRHRRRARAWCCAIPTRSSAGRCVSS